jgi:3-methyladenine DNA glycosylase AlkD
MSRLVEVIRAELKANTDEKTQASAQKFFKEQLVFYGVKTPLVRKIAKKYWREVKCLSKTEIFALCEELFRSGYSEEAFVVSNWLPNMIEKLTPSDLQTFKVWIERYINNWATCDAFCNHTIGDLIDKYPETLAKIKNWTESDNKWLRRAAAVSLILPARKGGFLHDVFEISDVLLCDKEDLVQKGYGWLLKEASKLHQKEVFDYILKHRKVMPRTSLRYAIELMPKDLKEKAMAMS